MSEFDDDGFEELDAVQEDGKFGGDSHCTAGRARDPVGADVGATALAAGRAWEVAVAAEFQPAGP